MARYAERTDIPLYGISPDALVGVAGVAATQDAHLDAATGLIDSYLRNRFAVPLTTWGVDIRAAAATIAAYTLMSIRGFSPQGMKDLLQRYENVIKWLRDIQDAQATPEGADASGGEGDIGTPVVVQAIVSSTADEDSFWSKDEGEHVVSVGTPKLRGW